MCVFQRDVKNIKQYIYIHEMFQIFLTYGTFGYVENIFVSQTQNISYNRQHQKFLFFAASMIYELQMHYSRVILTYDTSYVDNTPVNQLH